MRRRRAQSPLARIAQVLCEAKVPLHKTHTTATMLALGAVDFLPLVRLSFDQEYGYILESFGMIPEVPDPRWHAVVSTRSETAIVRYARKAVREARHSSVLRHHTPTGEVSRAV